MLEPRPPLHLASCRGSGESLIGRVVALYAEGVRDARGGRKRRRLPGERDYHRLLYLLGWKDERERMRARRQLDQKDLFLDADAT